ncbi:MAG: 50S ribosomal protein L18 [Candidatus Micrarchaeia archaeon]
MGRAKTPTYNVPFRRRREGKTNYQKRLALVKSNKTRMVIRKTNRSVIVQFVNYDKQGDKTLLIINGNTLEKKYGWPSKRNVYTSYLAGLMASKFAKEKKINDFVVDLGLAKAKKNGVLFGAVLGAIDGGLNTNFDQSVLPKEKMKNIPEKYGKKFEEVKKSILGK